MKKRTLDDRYLIGPCVLIAIASAVFPGAALGQDGGLTLGQCVSIALEENPLLLSAREQYRASLARISQARAFPQPTFSVDSDMQPSLTDIGGSQERYYGISELIPFPGKTYLRGRVAQSESGEILADVASLELELTYQVKATFYGLLLAHEKVAYAQENVDLSQDFADKTELKYTAGDVPRVEVIRARVEAARAVTELNRAVNEETLARARMNFLLARPGSTPLEIWGELKASPVPMELEHLTLWALSSRPEIQRIEASLEGASLTRKLGYMSYLPDFDLGAAQHRLAGEDNAWQVTLAVELPLFFWQPARGEIREANANSQVLRQEASHLRNAIALEVEEAHRSYTTAVQQIELMEEQIIAQAEEVYRMYLFSYQEGEISGIELIEAQRTLNEARTAYADSLYDYDMAIATLEKSIGRTLREN